MPSLPPNFKILGKDPAAVLGMVQAVLTMFLSFGLLGLTPETNGVILAAASGGLGLVAAYATRTTLYSALVGFAQSILVLAVTFGLNLDDVKQGAILSAVAVFAGFFLHQTTVSDETAISAASPGAVKQDLELLALESAVTQDAVRAQNFNLLAVPGPETDWRPGDVHPAIAAAVEAVSTPAPSLEGLAAQIQAESTPVPQQVVDSD